MWKPNKPDYVKKLRSDLLRWRKVLVLTPELFDKQCDIPDIPVYSLYVNKDCWKEKVESILNEFEDYINLYEKFHRSF